MLKIGDTVKVIGKTLDESGEEKELIPIGTICRIDRKSTRLNSSHMA